MLHYSGITKLEDAAELYTRAANQFKVAKNFESRLAAIYVSTIPPLSPSPSLSFPLPLSPSLSFSPSPSVAGRAHTEAAKLHADKLESRHEAANSYAEAAQTYKKVNPQGTLVCDHVTSHVTIISPEAVVCYEHSIAIYSDMVRTTHYRQTTSYHSNHYY